MSAVFLVGIDGSECSERAARFAAERASSMSAKLCVLFVIEWSPFSFSTAEENAQRHKRREDEVARARARVLDPLLDNIETSGIDVSGVIRHGHIAEVMMRVASEENAEALFIGRLGAGTLKSLMFGSVTSQLVQSSPIPVTVVP